MRIRWKLEVIRSGRWQHDLAQEIGISAARLSRFLRGFDVLAPAERERLRRACRAARLGGRVKERA